MKIGARCLLALSILVVSHSVSCREMSLTEMRQRCEQAREESIAPLREAAIAECVSRRRSARTKESCERIYSGFGQGGGTVSGSFRPGMFYDLPECVEYFEARDGERSN